MMLCMFGYLSLRISRFDYSPPLNPHVLPNIPCEEGQNSGNVILCLNEMDETRSVGSDYSQIEERATLTTKGTKKKYICLRIEIVEALQPLHIIFQWDSESKQATVEIGCDSINEAGQFCWRSRKDGFLGRICAQSEWRSTRLRSVNEPMLKYMTVPTVSEDNGEVYRFPIPIEHWPTCFSLTNEMAGDCSEVGCNSIDVEAEIDATVDVSELKCDCGCKAHNMFLEAKELEESGNENEALELLRQCVIDYGHCGALERYVRL